MRVTKKLFASACPAALMALPLALSMTPAFAQSTGTQDMETVTVTGLRVNTSGLMNAAPVAKERSVITSDFLETQTAGQTVFQSLNFMPGVNFTNNDPYGTSGGNIRMHGQDGNHISLTLDGMPLNDTGNYAIYTNQMLDPEVVDRVSALQGATDIDSPTAAATGGVINIQSDKPHEDFGAEGVLSGGQFGYQRYFGRVDSGKVGPWGTTAFATLSYQNYDKFKGDGELRKIQGNVKVYQDMGDLGWFSIAGHWNVNRNNNYYGEYYFPNTTGFSSSILTQVDTIKNPSGEGYVANPGWLNNSQQFSAGGWDRDYNSLCTYNRIQTPAQVTAHQSADVTSPSATAAAGQADYTMTTCGNYYKTRINPSDTGNIRFSSLWHLMSNLTLTLDANFQYVLATGGTTTTNMSEKDPKFVGSSSGGSGTTTTPFGCIAGVGCDLNGDGDVLDTVEIQSPSVTNTRRWGLSSSLIYQLTEDQTFQLAYTLDWGLHRQTGINGLINGLSGFYNPFGPVANDGKYEVKAADGTPIRYRDRKSFAIMNQIAFDWEGNWLDGVVQTSLGFRLPFFERRLNQYCYEALGSSSAYCTSMTPTSVDSTMNTVTIAGKTYVPGGKAVRRYSRFLPHLGLTVAPWGKEHQLFATYTQEIAAPRTDNLYTSGHVDPNNASSAWTFVEPIRPETSVTYQFGYRYLGDNLQAAVILWNSQVKNRIVSSYDPITNTYFDHNVKGVNFSGVDFEANYHILDGLVAYANAGYDHARITSDLIVGGGPVPTTNKQLSETPKWTLAGRLAYDITHEWNIGIESKYVSRRNQSEDNNAFVPDYYTVNLDSRYQLDQLGLTGSDLKVNVDNLFDKHYFGSLGTVTCWTPQAVGGTSGCTSIPYAYVGSPRTISATLTVRY